MESVNNIEKYTGKTGLMIICACKWWLSFVMNNKSLQRDFNEASQSSKMRWASSLIASRYFFESRNLEAPCWIVLQEIEFLSS